MRDALHGHLWTVAPHVAHLLRPQPAPRDEPWETQVDDPRHGPVRLTGWIRHRPGADTLVVLIHGLGGSADTRYMRITARACDEAGLSYLRLNLRGAERSGEDFYHAGMSDDLRATLSSAALARYRRVLIVGYSMGGHIALRWATEPGRDPRVCAMATVCAPLDLSYGAHAIQRAAGLPYQHYVLEKLKAMYAPYASRRGDGLSFERARAIRTILEWDQAVVVPRFGFENREHYYRSAAAGPRLAEVELPTLFVATRRDPVVTAGQLRPWLDAASDAVTVSWLARGGHIAFPSRVSLDGDAPAPLEPQLLRWLTARA